MSYTKYTTEELLACLYRGLLLEITARHENELVVEKYLEMFKYFSISNTIFVFSDTKKQTSASEYFKGMLLAENRKVLDVVNNEKMLTYILPFLKFKKNKFGVVHTSWYDINDLLKKFPTRRNLIDSILADL